MPRTPEPKSNDAWWDQDMDDDEKDALLAWVNTGDSDDWSYMDEDEGK